MKIATLAVGVVAATSLFFAQGAAVMAQAPLIAQTWVTGVVTDANGNPVNGDQGFEQVSVNCGGTIKQADIQADGTYAIIFTQEECAAGDGVTASATTEEGSGGNSGLVQNTSVNGPVVDLDIAVLNISVPEFGMIGGAITAMGATGAFLYMRKMGMV